MQLNLSSHSNSNPFSWALLGPCLLFVTLLTLIIKLKLGFVWIPLVALAGIPICWRWQLRGFTIALVILSSAITYQSWQLSFNESLWQIGLGTSIALAFLVTAIASSESESEFAPLQEKFKALQTEVTALKLDLSTIDNEKNALIIERNTSITNATELATERDHFRTALAATDSSLRSLNGKYKQLSEQFNEKSDTLNETRNQLFQVQELVNGLKHELKEVERVERTEDTIFNEHLAQVEKKYQTRLKELEQELEAQNDLITYLIKNDQFPAAPLSQQYVPRKPKERSDRLSSSPRPPKEYFATDRREHPSGAEGPTVTPETDRVRKLLLAGRTTGHGKSANRQIR